MYSDGFRYFGYTYLRKLKSKNEEIYDLISSEENQLKRFTYIYMCDSLDEKISSISKHEFLRLFDRKNINEEELNELEKCEYRASTMNSIVREFKEG